MIGVGMGVKNGVQAPDTFANSLLAKIGSGVYQYCPAGIFDQYGWAGAAIVRIGRIAYGTITTDGWDPHRSPASQHGQGSLHRFAAADAGACGGCASALVTSTY